MFNKVSRIVFIVLFLMMLVVPMITTNLKNDTISEAENRKLASKAELYNTDGTHNGHFAQDFEAWINDNIGFRSQMVVNNARIQYYFFKVLANNTDLYLGPKGELNYATEAMLTDYQHDNLYTEEYLQELADSVQFLSDYTVSKGASFYYYQCWDKHSIYPEYFPTSVLQYGDESKTDGIVRALVDYSEVNVISPKQALIDSKQTTSTYSVWGDPTHWNQRGAYIGYLQLMDAINSDNDYLYKVLRESDYNISLTDQGHTIFGGIHREEFIERFEIKEPMAVLTNEKLDVYSNDPRHRFFTNQAVDNDTRLLIIGDSYFNSFIVDDLAESFYEVIMIWGDHLADYQNIVDTYDADIVIVENAERVDRTGGIIVAANALREADDQKVEVK